MLHRLTLILATALILVLGAAALGQQTAPADDDSGSGETADDGVIELGPDYVEGEIDTPEATYILTPTDVQPGPLPPYTELGRDTQRAGSGDGSGSGALP